MIVQYIRDNLRNPTGVVVADVVKMFDGSFEIAVGWSRCNKKDRFNKKRGKEIALGRATAKNSIESLKDEFMQLPTEICIAIASIVNRAGKYYKQANSPPLLLSGATREIK